MGCLRDNCGIYILYFDDIIGRFYVGLSQDIKGRLHSHLTRLKNYTHPNTELQDAYNSVGVLPIYNTVEICTEDLLSTREIYWIDRFDAYSEGFNRNKGGTRTYGAWHGRAIHTEEDYLKVFFEIVNTNRTLKDIAETNYMSYEAIRDMSCGKSHRYLEGLFPKEYAILLNKSGTRSSNLYDENKYINILFTIANSDLSLKQVSSELGVSYQIVRNIAYGTNHKYLEKDFPEEYSKMLNKIRSNIGGVWQVTQ